MLYPVVSERPPPISVRKVLKPSCVNNAKMGLFKCEECPTAMRIVESTEGSNGGSVNGSKDKADDGTTSKSAGESEKEIIDADVLRDTTEEHEELHDALSPIYDQLSARWMWWILEYVPLMHRVQKHDGSNVKVLS